MRLAEDNTLTLVAGSLSRSGDEDGPAISKAAFGELNYLATDNAGCVYTAEQYRMRRIILPESLRARQASQDVGMSEEPGGAGSGGSGGAGSSGSGGGSRGSGRRGGRGGRGASSKAAAAKDATEAMVSTLSLGEIGAEADRLITGLAYVPGGSRTTPGYASGPGGGLVYSTLSCVRRIPVQPGPTAPVGQSSLLAGQPGDFRSLDGVGGNARFADIGGIVAEATGSIIAIDHDYVRRVAPDGTVTTLVQGLAGPRKEQFILPAILPGGQLAICKYGSPDVKLLDLGLDPVPLYPCPPAPPGPAPGSLAADLSALLEPGQGQAEGEASTSDLELRVGGRVFPVHRAILSARCPCFRRRLGGGFADAGAAELDLPDADPEAMEALLRWMYTGCLPPELPSSLLQPLAELSDRLGLMQPCRAAQGRILEAVCAQSVVGALLWAEQRGGGFAELLAGLKDWYLEHTEEVVDTARDTLQRLAAENPALSVELQVAWIKRPRTK
ncbi:hypothetical protein HYH03_008962 [Edaphochlamys debaryana]|uniref:BTB domain-containing protein n=1 Tax=Edaphochlamys debaryana TaxID=47281 RepID=A0A835Y052_9CHLO|nr:hypothetical protein HYH03_008962 [Edaphochlamys debaryana]|eukprot:KAG2492802.1 hypothetical protein HYH03_008962 [Edaphochlamys debaryana]